eukprot:SAG31_NODE_685_length_12832_cov_28.355376_12_plen_127_part_00
MIDHFGGGPTPGALQGAPHWNRFLALSKFDNVAVKISGWHPHGETGSKPIPPGGKDDYEVAGTACLELMGKYGASRSAPWLLCYNGLSPVLTLSPSLLQAYVRDQLPRTSCLCRRDKRVSATVARI